MVAGRRPLADFGQAAAVEWLAVEPLAVRQREVATAGWALGAVEQTSEVAGRMHRIA